MVGEVDGGVRKVVHVHFEMGKESINGGTILHGNFRLGILLFAKTQTLSSCINDILQSTTSLINFQKNRYKVRWVSKTVNHPTKLQYPAPSKAFHTPHHTHTHKASDTALEVSQMWH